MNTPEDTNWEDSRTPEQLMSDAESGFNMSHAFVRHDADHIRLGAAAMFELAAGKFLHEKLGALGITDDQVEEWAERGVLEEALKRLAPDEMDEVGQRVQRIAIDPHALNALENEVYFTDKELGFTQND